MDWKDVDMEKKLLTYAGLQKLEAELHDLKVVKRKAVAEKIKEAREQGDLSENAEYDAAKDEQRDIEARIEEIENILKNVEVVVEKKWIWIRSMLDVKFDFMTVNLKRKWNTVWLDPQKQTAWKERFPTNPLWEWL